MALGDLITSHTLLIEWYDAAAARADASPNNNRNQFDAAVVAVNPLFTAAFTDEALPVFETAGITSTAVFATILNAIRGNGPGTSDRLEQQELLVAVYLDDPLTPTLPPPGKGLAFSNAGFYLKDTNPNANEQAFVSHWSKFFGITRAEAQLLLDETIDELELLGALQSDYSDFAALAPIVVQLPDIELDADGNPIPHVIVES